MLNRIREIITRIRRKNNVRVEKADNEPNQNGGRIYALWLLILPLLVGVVLGRLADVGMGYALDKFAGSAGVSDRAVSGAQETEQTSEAKRGLDGFLAVNPFRISPQKPPEPEKPPEPTVEATPKEPEPTLDDVILRGTLPGVGAWVENKGKLSLMLVGKDNIDRYRLNSVTYSQATFKRGRQLITKYITYGPVVQKKAEEAPKVTATPRPAPEPPKQTGNIVAAAPGAQEGEIPSEMVNQLVQNPFDELKRIRMRPNEKAGGLEVQWIQNDSILKRLGVQRGDVIKSVNGIPFTNMGDIANSINSLMNSERFDVEVTRGGNNTALRYVVR